MGRPIAFVAGLISIVSASAQNLDEAVEDQLGFGPNLNQPCFELLDRGQASSDDALSGTLAVVCSRLAPQPGAGPTIAVGGAAATPTRRSTFGQQRAREARGDTVRPLARRTRPESEDVTGASADGLSSGVGWAFFLGVERENLDRDVTRLEAGYGSDVDRLTAGVDARFNRIFSLGLAADLTRHEGAFVGGGDFDNETRGFAAFATITPTEPAFIQVTAGYTTGDYSRTRFTEFVDTNDVTGGTREVVAGVLTGDYDGDVFRAGVVGGFVWDWHRVTLIPQASFDWARWEYDAYQETGATTSTFNTVEIPLGGPTGLELNFDATEVRSQVFSAGLSANAPFDTGFGLTILHAGGFWLREFESDLRTEPASFVGDNRRRAFDYLTGEIDEDWWEFSAGVTSLFDSGVYLTLGYRLLQSHDFFDSDTASLSIGYAR